VSSHEAVAIAHPNIALSKYWGKLAGEGNFPAVPSLSVTLRGLRTRTRVRFADELRADRLVLDGRERDGRERARVVELIDRVRGASNEKRFAEVESKNDFPTASGLASSASGFAALALAATRAAGLDWSAADVSALARRSSASAARSVFGGFVELEAGRTEAARPVAPPDHLDLRVVVAVTDEGVKAVGSTEAMRATANDSPYYAAWVAAAPRVHACLKDAIVARHFVAVGELAEASAMAMHACAIAAGIVYWNGATLAALAAVRALRAGGALAYATIDAGPHVKVMARSADAPAVVEAMAKVAGVLRVIETRPGDGARVEEAS
jgi:diphosphomevalonate decarboxylase